MSSNGYFSSGTELAVLRAELEQVRAAIREAEDPDIGPATVEFVRGMAARHVAGAGLVGAVAERAEAAAFDTAIMSMVTAVRLIVPVGVE